MALDNSTNMSLTRKAVKAELLDAETELQLAYAWRDSRDEAALHRLITAYMRLAISMAAKFKRYGAPMNDLVQEAGLGLMKAADKFDPDRGVRFSTYAVWWIKASVQAVSYTHLRAHETVLDLVCRLLLEKKNIPCNGMR